MAEVQAKVRPGPTKYTTVGDAMVGYQVTGDGPVDIVYMIGTGSNFEMWWDHAPFARMLERFASYGRLILFDRRGSGISDALPAGDLPTWEQYTEDIDAVLDAAGSRDAAIIAAFDGGAIALVYAAMNPQRVRAIVTWNAYARFTAAPDYDIGVSPEAQQALNDSLVEIWGTDELTRLLMPTFAHDEDVLRWHSRLLRGSATPASYARQNAQMSSVDARPSLPLIKAPVLAMNSTGHPMITPAMGRYIAEHVLTGRFVEVPGPHLDIYAAPNHDELEDMIEELITGVKPAARADRFLASVLFTDIVGSTERAARLGDARWKSLLEEHDRLTRSVVSSWRGELVKSTGDGVLTVFDGPGRALRCALDLGPSLKPLGIDIRSGVHFGEIDRRGNADIGGIGVHVAARAMSLAGDGEVLCTRTVKELSLGSGLTFEDRGTHTLKGVPDEWQLFVAQDPNWRGHG